MQNNTDSANFQYTANKKYRPYYVRNVIQLILILFVYKNFKRVFPQFGFSKRRDGLRKNDLTDFDEILMTSRKHYPTGIECTRLVKKIF